MKLCMRAAKALVSLRICADSHVPSLLIDAINTKLLCARQLYYMPDAVVKIVQFCKKEKKCVEKISTMFRSNLFCFSAMKMSNGFYLLHS